MELLLQLIDAAWKYGGPWAVACLGLAAVNVWQYRGREKLHRSRLKDARKATHVIIALVQRLARYERLDHHRTPTIPDFQPEDEEVTSVTIQRFERAAETARQHIEPESVEELCRQYLDGGGPGSDPPGGQE